jgi:transcriptional regulator with XRE-family HTH domain
MPQTSMVGTRIRERRVVAGLRQAELANRAGISPSYLNLIEHNRRRIGGKTLLQLAEALDVEPSFLSEGADATLKDALTAAAAMQSGHSAELDRLEEFAGRFPGWAGLLAQTAQRVATLEDTVQALTDRLAHDPHLAASLHEVISTVTAIRSTASILADSKDIEPEWRARFNRNINEDSRRLAEGAEALVRYLEAPPDRSTEIRSPQDELDAFLGDNGFHFPEIEVSGEDSSALIEGIVGAAPSLSSAAGRSLASAVLTQAAEDAHDLPLDRIEAALARHGADPDRLIEDLSVSPAHLFRRLAFLPGEMTGPLGLVTCDGSGTLVFRKPLPDFALPGAGGACPLWPLYQSLGHPGVPIRARLVQAGQISGPVEAYAIAEYLDVARFDVPARVVAHMLILPASPAKDRPMRQVGSTCRICPRSDCAARRERSILTKGF